MDKERARDDKGRYLGDDPSTPDTNEAYVMSNAEEGAQAKHALKSRGIWGGLIAVIAGAALVWFNQNGIEANADLTAALEFLSVVGGAVAVWGSANANAPVYFKKGE